MKYLIFLMLMTNEAYANNACVSKCMTGELKLPHITCAEICNGIDKQNERRQQLIQYDIDTHEQRIQELEDDADERREHELLNGGGQ